MLRNTDIEQTLPHLPTLLACHSQNAQDAFDYTSRVAIPNSISELRYLASLNLFSANIGVGYSTDRRAKTGRFSLWPTVARMAPGPAPPRPPLHTQNMLAGLQFLPASLFTLSACSQGFSPSLPPSSHSEHARSAPVPPCLPLHTQNMLAGLQFLPASLFTLSACSQGPLPASLFTLASLHRIELSDNWISGSIPESIGCAVGRGYQWGMQVWCSC